MNTLTVRTTSCLCSVSPIVVVESPGCPWITRSCLPSPAKSFCGPKLCHILEPMNTAATTTPMHRLTRIPRVVRRRRRSRSGLSDTVDLPGQLGTTFVEPTLQDRHRRRLVDDPTLALGLDPGLAQRSLRADGGQAFVGQPHRNRRDQPR